MHPLQWMGKTWNLASQLPPNADRTKSAISCHFHLNLQDTNVFTGFLSEIQANRLHHSLPQTAVGGFRRCDFDRRPACSGWCTRRLEENRETRFGLYHCDALLHCLQNNYVRLADWMWDHSLVESDFSLDEFVYNSVKTKLALCLSEVSTERPVFPVSRQWINVASCDSMALARLWFDGSFPRSEKLW